MFNRKGHDSVQGVNEGSFGVEDAELTFEEPKQEGHMHKWHYVAGETVGPDSANKLFAYCSQTEDKCNFFGASDTELDNALVLELFAEDAVCTGKPYAGASIPEEQKNAWKDAGLTVPTIYFEAPGYDSSTPPINVREYTATILMARKAARKNFKITKQEIDSAEVKLKGGNETNYIGSEVSNDVEEVRINGIALKRDSDYTVSGETRATEFGTYTILVNGMGNFVGSKEVRWTIACVEHQWDAGTPIEEASCTMPGKMLFTCVNCQKTKEEESAPVGHQFSADFEIDIEPTCVTKGCKSRHCTRCEEKTDIISIDETGHEWEDGADNVEPTCTEGGKHSRKCVKCQIVENEEVGPLGHDFASEFEYDVETTCTSDGVLSRHCTRCGEKTDTKTEASIGHVWSDGDVEVEPTCTETGKKVFICTRCGEEKEEEIPALGHDYPEEYTVEREATCEVPALKSKTCRRCGERGEVIEDSTEGHDWDEGTIVGDISCVEDGKIEYTCRKCGNKFVDSVPALGHDWAKDFTFDIEATCTTSGTKSIHCRRCEETKDVTVIDAKGHTWDEGSITREATCTEDGEQVFICTTCDEMDVKVLPALGHDFDTEFTIDLEPKGEEKGIKSRHCKRCEERTDITEIEPIPHDWDEGKIGVEPTCTEEGTMVYTCRNTGDTRKMPIPALGHQWNDKEVVPPTCTEDGHKTVECEFCGETKTEVIPTTGHDFDEEYRIERQATCYTSGVKSKRCKLCNELYSTMEYEIDMDGNETVVKETVVFGDEEALKEHERSDAEAVAKGEAAEAAAKKAEEEAAAAKKAEEEAAAAAAKKAEEEAAAAAAKKAEEEAAAAKKAEEEAAAAKKAEEEAAAAKKAEEEAAAAKKAEESNSNTEEGVDLFVEPPASAANQTIDGGLSGYKDPIFNWTADDSCEARFEPKDKSLCSKTLDCIIKGKVINKASGSDKGQIIFTASITLEGKTFTDQRTVDTEMVDIEEIGEGTLSTEIFVSRDVPHTVIDNYKLDVAREVLTSRDYEDIKVGQDITLSLEITSVDDSVSDDDVDEARDFVDGVIETYLRDDPAIESESQIDTGIMFLDISLFKKIGNYDAYKVRTTQGKMIQITMEIPESMKNKNTKHFKVEREYCVLCIHENKRGDIVTELLPTTINGTDSITFETDKFSTYVLIYFELHPSADGVTMEERKKKKKVLPNMLISSGVASLGLIISKKRR